MLKTLCDKRHLRPRLNNNGISLKVGPFNVNLRSTHRSVIKAISTLYPASAHISNNEFIDYYININSPSLLRRFFRPQIQFELDGRIPFKPLPIGEAYALFEWGLNWCVATTAHQYFMLHSAVLEKEGKSVIFPAPPGSGKSTLCAELAFSGWRLLSDEFALLSHDATTLTPFVRPISLKNESVSIINSRHPNINIGSFIVNTSKGDVAHIEPPATALAHANTKTTPRWIIFPKYEANSPLKITELSKPDGMIAVIENSFNYNQLGATAFHACRKLCQDVTIYTLTYSNLDEALAFMDSLINNDNGIGV